MSKTQFTFKKQKGGAYELYAPSTKETIIARADHPKYGWLDSQDQGRVINVYTDGKMTSAKDYFGLYKSVPTKKAAKLKINLTKLDNLKFSDDLFVPLKTNTSIDSFLSNDGGYMPGSNIMAAGAPGVGKTTVLLETLYSVQKSDPTKKVLFISAEMNQLDMARYLKRFPHWGQLPILFLSDYVDENPQAVIEQTLAQVGT